MAEHSDAMRPHFSLARAAKEPFTTGQHEMASSASVWSHLCANAADYADHLIAKD